MRADLPSTLYATTKEVCVPGLSTEITFTVLYLNLKDS